jgi:hypothetical protein
MRSPLDLFELPYAFTQLPLLAADEFASLARQRDVLLDLWRLEAVHQLGLLVPLFRVKRPIDDIRASFRRGDEHRAHVVANWEPKRRADLLEAVEERLLFDPATERFRSQRSFAREVGSYKFNAGVYLYSRHQLACLEPVRRLLPSIGWRRRGASFSAQLNIDDAPRADWLEQAGKLRDAVIGIVALEPVYYSQIIRTLTTPVHFDTDAFLRWRFELGPRWLLDWLDIDSDWVRERAVEILGAAQRLDKLGRWSEILGAGSPKRWDELEGVPRLVMDMRMAGEILLRYYDRLVNEQLATPCGVPKIGSTRKSCHSRGPIGVLHPTAVRKFGRTSQNIRFAGKTEFVQPIGES